MQAIFIRTFVFLFLLAVINPFSSPAATEQRTALVIGNAAYSSGPLKNPVNDAADMAALLKRLGFSVTLKKNVGLQEMEEAIESFGSQLKRGGVGLFYYAGHGVQVNGANYLLPIGAKINKEADVKYQSVDANKILDEMATANNGLNIVMLDACRDNPFGRSFRNASRGLAIVSSAPSGTFISYSTSPGNVARDGEGRNSPYTAALLKYLQSPGLSISDVFINVRAKVKKETGQVPWELSSLEGQFYFVPGKSPTTGSFGKMTVVSDELDDENQKLEEQQRLLEEEKASFVKKKVMEEKRQKIAQEREQLAAEQEALEREKTKKITSLGMGGAASKEAAKRQNKETAYALAYQAFRDGQYEKSRAEFINFLATYPDAEYAGNAQFWIGECYYFEKNYEHAILEYEKVSKNYPTGNKVPSALLKQGLSFMGLNDKTSARLILQQVIRDFPNTVHARVARLKLQDIK